MAPVGSMGRLHGCDLSNLLPCVVSARTHELGNLHARLVARNRGVSESPQLWSVPFAGDYALGLALWDRIDPDVWDSDFLGVTLSSDEIFQTAIDNLTRRSKLDFIELSPGLFVSPWRDGFDPARLLFVDRIAQLEVKGDPVAIVLNANMVLISGSRDLNGLDLMLTLCTENSYAPGAILVPPITLLDNYWAPYTVPDNHPLSNKMERINRLMMLTFKKGENAIQRELHMPGQPMVEIFNPSLAAAMPEPPTELEFSLDQIEQMIGAKVHPFVKLSGPCMLKTDGLRQNFTSVTTVKELVAYYMQQFNTGNAFKRTTEHGDFFQIVEYMPGYTRMAAIGPSRVPNETQLGLFRTVQLDCPMLQKHLMKANHSNRKLEEEIGCQIYPEAKMVGEPKVKENTTNYVFEVRDHPDRIARFYRIEIKGPNAVFLPEDERGVQVVMDSARKLSVTMRKPTDGVMRFSITCETKPGKFSSNLQIVADVLK